MYVYVYTYEFVQTLQLFTHKPNRISKIEKRQRLGFSYFCMSGSDLHMSNAPALQHPSMLTVNPDALGAGAGSGNGAPGVGGGGADTAEPEGKGRRRKTKKNGENSQVPPPPPAKPEVPVTPLDKAKALARSVFLTVNKRQCFCFPQPSTMFVMPRFHQFDVWPFSIHQG